MAGGMNDTPRSDRFTIGIFGVTNAGKSSLINALTGQQLALTSPVAGTTTDPVKKSMELLPIGPVLLIDTAGLGDTGELGSARMEKTYEEMRRCDLAVVVIPVDQGIGAEEKKLIERLKKAVIPSVVAVNFCDDGVPDKRVREHFAETGLPVCYVSAKTGMGIEELKKTIADNAEYDGPDLGLIKGLVGPGETAVLVVPVDKAAPKGRLILPQQQTIRDLLDHKAMAIIAQPETLESVLENMKNPPKIVITDSQAFSEVAKRVPAEIPMTSFSILFARQKGDLLYLREGAAMIRKLKAGDKVLVLEGCTHHRQEDDIGTVKIPRLIRKVAGQDIQFEWYRGNSLPDNFEEYALIVHCGACMLNRREMQYRLRTAAEQDVPVTNYGMAIAEVLGILPRAMEPFGNLSKGC